MKLCTILGFSQGTEEKDKERESRSAKGPEKGQGWGRQRDVEEEVGGGKGN